ncbi:BTAD domain-containing putative transcriptional regulator [Spirilliplanes yamanashiensis]|uniref:BTAD domain-containing putative transcriptional regulator n=1 Tax=Spirilliplanes yamanashiensis TaxID=42233 RepID=UPI00194F0689|nr:BTAD domain-containing putative transcriptional regulator [Spirilliplanes yamanashiensis]MDP9817272.1 DNA-binding SARP family transcriptional activator [Spirilliplanes yamanashiensis]
MGIGFGVLGPVVAWDDAGAPVDLKGPRHRAVLARLVVARGRVVPVGGLVDALWPDPPAGAVSAVRTFVAALRRNLEPGRPPRAPARLLVTVGPGYALQAAPHAVDAWRFEAAVAAAASAPPHRAAALLGEALAWWRGPAYADFAPESWAAAERSRLEQLRLNAVEQRAQARLAAGGAAEVVPDLDAHVADHPWREDGWRLLATALYRAGRQADALGVLRRARHLLADRLGLEPGPALRRLETDILRQAGDDGAGAGPERIWADAAAAYDRAVAAGARARLESTVGLLRGLAVSGPGGLAAARDHRVQAIAAAERLGDADLTARVIGGYDVPTVWTRPDDLAQAAQIVAAAERALAALPPGAPDATRARLLATVAVESRGTAGPRGPAAAAEAERIARALGDPALLAFALDGVFVQRCHRAGLAGDRDRIGAELVGLAARNGLATFEILGHLVRVQARSALADFVAADRHAAAADALAERHERPLTGVFTAWYAALRLAATGSPDAADAYREAAARLAGAGMPGVERGLLPLALLCLRVSRGEPADPGDDPGDADGWGPYRPWAAPLLLHARGRAAEAAEALRRTPEPPPGLLLEALWCLTGRAAVLVGDRAAMARARAALAPAAHELAGAGSGMLTAGPVAHHLDRLAAALGRDEPDPPVTSRAG